MHEKKEESMDVQTLLQGVRCAAHTLQLAILDALEEPDIAIIAKVRVACKVLRSQSFKAAIWLAGQKKPIIDCLTCWCSTCLMLERLIELKEFISELTKTKKNPSLKRTGQHWSFLSYLKVAHRAVEDSCNPSVLHTCETDPYQDLVKVCFTDLEQICYLSSVFTLVKDILFFFCITGLVWYGTVWYMFGFPMEN
ncbi:hypothetical protein DAPPUDRAFT_318888 [Daphnia pulex]|uniref:Uncharacterized protein n=1 Tax=Daphnia pulex TaxID=6669 RepID=E9GJY1_DAPPU|nr:hypothetical protein DAPPUDRAFT_318888 [Daphnia pulex]|eukprot:EFX80196.1 hypothetical protein DAPPUDRAFT_318888 [Daphnia pulex]